jgi:hypothetical protein
VQAGSFFCKCSVLILRYFEVVGRGKISLFVWGVQCANQPARVAHTALLLRGGDVQYFAAHLDRRRKHAAPSGSGGRRHACGVGCWSNKPNHCTFDFASHPSPRSHAHFSSSCALACMHACTRASNTLSSLVRLHDSQSGVAFLGFPDETSTYTEGTQVRRQHHTCMHLQFPPKLMTKEHPMLHTHTHTHGCGW